MPTLDEILRTKQERIDEVHRLQSDRVIGDVFETFSKHPPGTKIKVEER